MVAATSFDEFLLLGPGKFKFMWTFKSLFSFLFSFASFFRVGSGAWFSLLLALLASSVNFLTLLILKLLALEFLDYSCKLSL